MKRQIKTVVKTIVLSTTLIFPSWSMMGVAAAEAPLKGGGEEAQTSQGHKEKSIDKRQGQSPKNKQTSPDTQKHGGPSLGKRPGQSPVSKPSSADSQEPGAMSGDKRQGQSPGGQ
ncbi:MAG: hypothetical protein JSR31_00035 [Nitrospira sp.]|nr:hypothetical protein [Nitrospira sp.]